MAGEWPEDRIGNLNADAAANRAQITSRPSLQEADEMVNSWKKRIKEHQELLNMPLDVSKAVTNRQKGIAHALANPLENPWRGTWPRATCGLNDSPVGLAWTLAVVKHSEQLIWGGPSRNTKQSDRTVTYVELAIDCYLATGRWPPKWDYQAKKWRLHGSAGWEHPSLHEAGRAYRVAATWMAQHVAGTKAFTQVHTALPFKTSRVSSLRWLGSTSTALGISKPVQMTRHEETKKIVRALMEPIAEEMMVLTDAVWSELIISGNISAPPITFGDAAVAAYAGALAMRDNRFSVFQPPPAVGT